jgi:hypothetical protein
MSSDGVRSEIVRGLSVKFRARDLIPAGACRAAAEMAREFRGTIPTAAIDQCLAFFETRLMVALDAVQTPHADEDEAAG